MEDEEGEWSLGRDGWKTPEIGETQLVFGRNGEVLAAFQFHEAPRPDAEREIAALTRQFAGIAVLSGDRQERVSAVSRQIGLGDSPALGNLKPEDKAAWLKSNQADETLFLGDGANDSLGFDVALCSGMPAADGSILESKADFCFLGQGLSVLRELFAAARHRQHVLFQVFAFAVIYNLAAVALCLMGKMNPLLAAVLMPLSSLVTIGLAALAGRNVTWDSSRVE